MELKLRLPIRQLVEFLLRSGSIDSRFSGFDRALEGARIHRRLQKAGGEDYKAEVALKQEWRCGEAVFTLEGRADGIFPDKETGLCCIDEIKTTSLPAAQITEDHQPVHWAQGKVYAAIWAKQNELEEIAVRLTYYQTDTGEILRYTRQFSAGELEAFVQGLLEEYLPWAQRAAEWKEARGRDLTVLPFPFDRYRTGQRALAGVIYKTICEGGNLLVQAPTGTGKTISALFPALRAMGEGKGDTIFYLTAKTTTRAAAEEALERLRQVSPGLHLRSLTLTAKEKICFLDQPACMPDRCPYANGYFDRIKNAVWDGLDRTVFDRAGVQQLAQAHTVCPFELALDLSLWCDVIVGDYNHLFDPAASLKRFFETAGDYLFLIDEAHNLPDRAREMYSAALCKSRFAEAKKALGKGRGKPKTALHKVDAAMLELRRLCEEEGGSSRTVVQTQAPSALHKALEQLVPPLQDWLEEHEGSEAHPVLLQLYFDVKFYLRVAEMYDDHYVMLLHAFGRDVRVCQLCLDPADFLAAQLAKGRAGVLFSATLSPGGFYRDLLGAGEDAKLAALPSPFASRRLGLFCLPADTRYEQRQASAGHIAQCIAAMASARTGNYMAFFPSYAYLQLVLEEFQKGWPELAVQVQQPGLDDEARAAFLAAFSEDPAETLVGFCVMGGVFGEGVDLAGSRLIGAAIVGVGLPQVNARQQALRDYYEDKNGQGFAYAYQYPGWNKVLQAAGRVIRTETDRGVVLLLDERFSQPRYRRLMPPHWQHCKYLSSPRQLQDELAVFWDAEEEV